MNDARTIYMKRPPDNKQKRPLPIAGKGLTYKKDPYQPNGKGLANNDKVANIAESTKLRNDDYIVKATPL
jgi:hypothetical protein